MKKIKLFPAPHVEVRLHISDQMITDYQNCLEQSKKEDFDGMDCDKCSWCDVAWLEHGLCELNELRKLIGGEESKTALERMGRR